MSDHDTSKQIPTSEGENEQPTGERSEGGQPGFGQPETGEAQGGEPATGEATDVDTITQTETGEETGLDDNQTTGESQAGFVASKDEDSGDYLQERGENTDETDIEGSSQFGTNGE